MITDFYNSSALVEQATRAASTSKVGGVKSTYSTRIASLSCRVTASNISEVDAFGKRTMREIWKLYCAATTASKAIEESDRVTVDSRVYQITGIKNPGLLDRHLEISLEEVR
jgi:hypothetical protein